jgi:hypothetical protein
LYTIFSFGPDHRFGGRNSGTKLLCRDADCYSCIAIRFSLLISWEEISGDRAVRLIFHWFTLQDQNNLFMVRIAQGLVHLGKGTLTLNPFHSDRTLMSPVAVAGIISVLVAMLDVKESYSLPDNC